jgi:DNA-directed RNA polymerase specialized sigma24 family protein
MRRNILSRDNKKHSYAYRPQLRETETPADKAFPEQTDIQLYESLFWSTFKNLPETCRQVLILHWKDLDLQEISTRLNTSEADAMDQKCACTLKFVEMVKSHKDYELLRCTTSAFNNENPGI